MVSKGKYAAMILAAGMGTRLGSLTHDRPKALIPVHGVPLLEIILRKIITSGMNDVVINVHHHAGMIREFLEKNHNFGIRIFLTEEQPHPYETGGAVRNAREILKEYDAWMIHNVDVLTNLPLERLFRESLELDAPVILAVRSRRATRYLIEDDEGNLCGWEDARSGESIRVRQPLGETRRVGFSGIQVMKREVLDLLPQQQTFSLTPFYLDLASRQEVKLWHHDEGYWYDAGKPETLEKIRRTIAPEDIV